MIPCAATKLGNVIWGIHRRCNFHSPLSLDFKILLWSNKIEWILNLTPVGGGQCSPENEKKPLFHLLFLKRKIMKHIFSVE